MRRTSLGDSYRVSVTETSGELPSGNGDSVVVPETRRSGWSLSSLAGRLVEISAGLAGAPLTLAFRLVLEAQRKGEPTAWVGRRESVFYPPDAAAAGVDLA